MNVTIAEVFKEKVWSTPLDGWELILREPYSDNVLVFNFESIKEAYGFVKGLRQGLKYSISTDSYEVLETNLPHFPEKITPPEKPISSGA